MVVFQFGCPNLNLNLELTLMYSRKTNKTKTKKEQNYLNSSMRSLKARISVGHTKVNAKG